MTNILAKDFLKDDTVSKLYRASSLLNAIHKVSENVTLGISEDPSARDEKVVLIDFYKRLNLAASEMFSSAHHLAKRQNTNTRDGLLKDLLHIASMINLAKQNFHMSDMNAELLTRGCLYLRDIVNGLNIKDEPGIVRSEEDVNDEIESIKDNRENLTSRTYKEVESLVKASGKTEVKAYALGHGSLKDNTKDLSKSFSKFTAYKPEQKIYKTEKEEKLMTDDRKSSRRDQVLGLLSMEPISIKDISEKIVGCSEKTIQRELNALVDAKKITRIGEKRWSRYTLAR